jgi:hypothetical protein
VWRRALALRESVLEIGKAVKVLETPNAPNQLVVLEPLTQFS